MEDANFIKDDRKFVVVYLRKKGIVNENTTEYLRNLFKHSPIFTYITFLDILPHILEKQMAKFKWGLSENNCLHKGVRLVANLFKNFLRRGVRLK